MKKFLSSLAILFCLAGIMAAQTASFTAPTAKILMIDSTEKIQWTFTGATAISLVIQKQGDSNVWIIKSGLALSAGTFSWQVGKLQGGLSLPPDKNYMLKMRRDSTMAILATAGPFEIGKAQVILPSIPADEPPPANMIDPNRRRRPVNPNQMLPILRVLKPADGTQAKPGDPCPIEWSLPGGGYNAVKIMLYPAGQPQLAAAGQVQWLTMSTQNNGAFPWKIDALSRTGNYVVRVQTLDNRIYGDSGVLTIASAPNPNLVHSRAPNIDTLLSQSAAISIDLMDFQMPQLGTLSGVGLIVLVNSASDFVLTPLLGHPKFGSLYLHCVIETPYFDSKGKFFPTKIVDAVYSLKGSPPLALSAWPANVPKGQTKFNVSFVPDCKGQAIGQEVHQKFVRTILSSGKTCKQQFYPKMTVTLHLVTKNGEAKASKTIYLKYNTKAWPLPAVLWEGEINWCNEGMQDW